MFKFDLEVDTILITFFLKRRFSAITQLFRPAWSTRSSLSFESSYARTHFVLSHYLVVLYILLYVECRVGPGTSVDSLECNSRYFAHSSSPGNYIYIDTFG